jgi:glycosyltransferase involved in cell wall biosynthesis
MPKLVFISKSTGIGGAALAALRLFRAHKSYLSAWDMQFLAQEGKLNEDGVHILTKGGFSKYGNLSRLALEKLTFLFYEKSKEIRFQFSIANTGRDISNSPFIQRADLIHLHWLYQGFLSVNGIDRLFHKGIAVVWTLHDMWPFTGGCHYPGDCTRYKDSCGECPFLRNPATNDLSNRIIKKKHTLFDKYPDIVFVSCSEWLARSARESSILGKHRIEVIPNTIDINIFSPGDKQNAREKLGIEKNKFIILFGAANINDKRKGFDYLVNALDKLKSDYPADAADIDLMVFGKAGAHLPTGYQVYNQNLVSSENMLADIYRAADVFVLPSLEDNLPNTIMESLSCGTPVVAFNSGGIPEMIDHMQNGYLAEYKNTDELVKGILWIKGQAREELASSSRNKVLNNYHPEKISNAYKKLYLSLIK